MKIKTVLYFLMVTTLISCKKSNITEVKTDYVIGTNNPLIIVKIDKCEYLYGQLEGHTVLTHKGNCVNHKKK